MARSYNPARLVGTILNHCRVIKALGEGGMGEVYLAEDTRLKRQVAIKILPAAVADDPARRDRFEREAQTVAALNHPNIVTVHSVEHSGAASFITLEFVDGRTLAEMIPKNGLPVRRLLTLATQIAEAVSAARRELTVVLPAAGVRRRHLGRSLLTLFHVLDRADPPSHRTRVSRQRGSGARVNAIAMMFGPDATATN